MDKKQLIEEGIKAGDIDMYSEDAIWCRSSGDKVDIAQELMKVIRWLFRDAPEDKELRALSIGSGSEPQFRILEPACRGGLYLLDIDSVPLLVIKKRVKNHWIDHVYTVQADYNKVLIRADDAEKFLMEYLDGSKQDIVTLHHSLYYSDESDWAELFDSILEIILADTGAIHAVMMSSNCRECDSTTWLYNHFAGKFFNCTNDQDLVSFGRELGKRRESLSIRQETHKVKFFVDDFSKFMAVIWMILLYPNVHEYSSDQKKEITEYVYSNFFKPRKPLIQLQDHLVISR